MEPHLTHGSDERNASRRHPVLYDHDDAFTRGVTAEEFARLREAFSIDRCINCHYLLHGLPEQGRCPECGTEYDRSMLLVAGPPPPRSMPLRYLIAACIFIGLGWLWNTMFILVVGVAFLIISAVQSYRWWTLGPTADQIFVSIDRAGIRLTKGPGSAPPKPWRRFGRVRLVRHYQRLRDFGREPNRWLMQIYPPFLSVRMSPLQFSFMAASTDAFALRRYIESLIRDARAI